MGQEFSLDDIIKPSPKTDGILDQLISNVTKRIKRDNPESSPHFIVYTRHRTHQGAPTINRFSYDEDTLQTFEESNDGFPLAATQSEIEEFDNNFFGSNRHSGSNSPKTPKKQRSRSLTSLSNRLPALSRPKFVDRLITGASNLSKKSPGKQKQYKRNLSDQSIFYCNNSISEDSVEEVSSIKGSSESLSTKSDKAEFCCQCGSFIPETEGLNRGPCGLDDTKPICSACDTQNKVAGKKDSSKPSDNQLKQRYNFQEKAPVQLRESDRKGGANCRSNRYLTIVAAENGDIHGVGKLVNGGGVGNFYVEQSKPSLTESQPELFNLTSSSYVSHQLQVFSAVSHSHSGSPQLVKKPQRSHSERPTLVQSTSLRSLHRRPSSPKEERNNRWVKGSHNIACGSRFTQLIMAKGYVKAVAEQINHQRISKQVEDEDDTDRRDILDIVTHRETEDNGDTGLPSSLGVYKDDAMRSSLVKSLIKAAESKKANEDGASNSKFKKGHEKSDVPASKFGLQKQQSSNKSSPDRSPTSPSAINGGFSHMSHSDPRSTPSEKLKGKPHLPSKNASESFDAQRPNKITPNSPEVFSSKRSLSCKSPQSPRGEKPPVNYGSKPKVPPKKPSLTSNSLKIHNKSQTPSPTSSSPSHSPTASSSPAKSLPSPVTKTKPETFFPQHAGSGNPQVCDREKSPPVNEEKTPVTIRTDGVTLRPESARSSDHYRDSVFKTIYDNGEPLSAAELFDSSWSDTDSYDEFEDKDEQADDAGENGSSSQIEEPITAKVCEPQEAQVCPEDKRLKIAQELLQTEKDYVNRLHLLHQVFFFRLDKENRQQTFLPDDTLQHMFSNIKSIFLFHHDFLLPQLELRMNTWETDPRIGDLMKKNAPFLKLYSEYIRNFDRAMKLINQWMEKSVRFSEIIQEIQKLPECGNLSLQHHMLGPIQRVPRYELLLKDYVKHLPKESNDFTDANDALDLVTKAACHSNEAMKKIETFHKLLDIYQSLRGVPMDFISPTREFVCQGPVTKIAARSGEKQPRQIFLFNDLVLICVQINLLGTYNVRSQLEVASMEIKPGTNMNIPNTFMIHSKQKAVELLDENPAGETFGWEEKLQEVIRSHKKRKQSIKHDNVTQPVDEAAVPESCLGKMAPVWIADTAATMCMMPACQMTFNMVRRRHHCRACGKLVCKSCCKKAPLEYKKGKIERVCLVCYDVIVNKGGGEDSPDYGLGEGTGKKKGILQVKASEPGLISNYMQCSEDGGHTWQKLWVTAHRDFVLYSFRAHEDVSAISSLPLPGHTLTQVWDIENRPHVFSLSHKKKKALYQADNKKQMKKWLSVLGKLVKAELPDENARLSTQSNSSHGSATSANAVNGCSIDSNNRSSTHSGSQADSGCPGDSNNSLATYVDDDNADGISQYDNIDGVITDDKAES